MPAGLDQAERERCFPTAGAAHNEQSAIEETVQEYKQAFPGARMAVIDNASTDGTIEVWGDGTAVRSFVYVTDLVDGIRRLMDSDETRPTNS